MMNRRGFLSAILAAGVAPAFVGSSVLMPVRKLLVPDDWIYLSNNFKYRVAGQVVYIVTVGGGGGISTGPSYGTNGFEWIAGGAGGGGSPLAPLELR